MVRKKKSNELRSRPSHLQKPKSSAKDVLAEAGKHTNYAELALFDKVHMHTHTHTCTPPTSPQHTHTHTSHTHVWPEGRKLCNGHVVVRCHRVTQCHIADENLEEPKGG